VIGHGGDSGAQINAWEGAVRDGTASFEAMFPNCQRPRDMLNDCRHAVIKNKGNEGEVKNCLRESQCYLACSSSHNKQKKTVNSQCGSVLFDGPARSIRDRFKGCLGANKDDATLCESKLLLMLTCARKVQVKAY
jgi:hypothetical protein